MLNTYCPNPPFVYKDAGSLISGATAVRGEDSEQVHDHSELQEEERREREHASLIKYVSHGISYLGHPHLHIHHIT